MHWATTSYWPMEQAVWRSRGTSSSSRRSSDSPSHRERLEPSCSDSLASKFGPVCALGSMQVGSMQVGSIQVGSIQVGSIQVGSMQVGSMQVLLGGRRLLLGLSSPWSFGAPQSLQGARGFLFCREDMWCRVNLLEQGRRFLWDTGSAARRAAVPGLCRLHVFNWRDFKVESKSRALSRAGCPGGSRLGASGRRRTRFPLEGRRVFREKPFLLEGRRVFREKPFLLEGRRVFREKPFLLEGRRVFREEVEPERVTRLLRSALGHSVPSVPLENESDWGYFPDGEGEPPANRHKGPGCVSLRLDHCRLLPRRC
ncbi:hypothetical protein EYF80_050141 [Liparis tanakae]|uniref:Uncharacterized protein n=1 Tax=Liparis tanakae TaxID=230148 RepID=A0A4Z2FEQ1_9TELE|nr:hypothetical protein EYF80_050141 [Liparis tanakae]